MVNLNQINVNMKSFDKLLAWFTHVVLRFNSYILSYMDDKGYIWREKVVKMLAVSYTQFCSKAFISHIITNFPESTPTLEDLKKALVLSNLN